MGGDEDKVKRDGLPTISIVDDDEAVRMALRMLILSFGWRAHAFESGKSFLDAFSDIQPDCVVLDLNMPGMTGAEVQETLRDRGIRVPVIVVTGQRDPMLLSRARAAGAFELLSKPFQDAELKSSIEKALSRVH